MKWLFFWVCFFLFQSGYAQTDIVSLSKIKDFINAGLTHTILSNDSIRKNNGDKNWSEIDTVFQKNNLQSPFYFAAMQQFLHGKFDSVAKNFSARVDLIDIKQYQHLDEQKAMQSLYDTAFAILQKEFPFVLPSVSRDSLYQNLLVRANVQNRSRPQVEDTIPDLTIKTLPATDYSPWYKNSGGLVFWLLTATLIFGGLFLYLFFKMRQLKMSLEASENTTKAKEETPPEVAHQIPISEVYTEFKNLVTLKIKDLYDSIEHLNSRIATLEVEQPPPASLNEEAPLIDDSINNEEIFYMSVPLPGHFPFSSRSLKKDALYKFVLNGTNKEAHYEVINDGFPVGGALNDMPKFFEHACIVEDEPQGEVRVVITKDPGVALFDDGKWIIKQKATIVFI
jgi:hypothetical protein